MYSAPEMIAASNEIKAPIDSDCKIVRQTEGLKRFQAVPLLLSTFISFASVSFTSVEHASITFTSRLLAAR